MANPYSKGQQGSKKVVVARKSATKHTAIAASDLKLPGSNQHAVGSNGEINASDNNDLIQNIAKMLAMSTNQGVTHMTDADADRRETATVRQQHTEMANAMFGDGNLHREVGEVIAEEIKIAADRSGFMRRLLTRGEVTQGGRPEVRVRMKQVAASVAVGPTRTQTQIVRDNKIFPEEFYVTARPFIEQRDINTSNTDIIEEKYLEGLEAFAVREDRIWKRLADNTTQQGNPAANPLTTVFGALSPSTLTAVRSDVGRWNLPVANLLVAYDLWDDFASNSDFSTLISPVSQHELLVTGKLGVILGMDVITDGFRNPEHKVLNQGEFYVVADPVNHGQYTDREGISSLPTDGTNERIPGRGWYFSEVLSMVVANGRSVAKGVRLR